ncbi:insulinase family protein [Streptomyces sp. NBC_01764]|uniref:insulinase family protein n=1 Tax=Streptomyces sp. NBC_01764 TaxID=2975935 RepID=UPI00225B76B8|nr:insulinase family protein [Streptomyces sp. NBC_01764]MCX4409322.1 insulinase family protein [Streptomyces sp. NBC_01764]
MSQGIHHTEVDGIPTLFAYATGPMRAGLVFRVGVADETLAGAGITHLVEHLALHRQGLADYHFNGATKAAFTHFHVEGAEHEVVAYLDGVCTSLLDLPMERLETEKEILRTEEAGREPGQLPLWRYGAQGYGLVSYPEWGVRGLRPDDVRAWAGTWFTRDNAVLWIAGERLPAGLSLKLPGGRRHPMPAVTSALPTAPAYFSDGKGGVLLDAVVTDTTAARLYAGVLERELSRSLRQEGGYSYTAAADYASRRDGYATVTAFADALPAKQDAVLGGFVDVLAGLQVGRITQADLEAVRGRSDATLTAPDAAVRRLPGAAEDLLAHRQPRGLDELRAELWAVTPQHVHAVALEAAGTALLQAPSGHKADWAGYTAAPTTSSYAVTGTRFEAVRKGGPALVVGGEGVSLTAGGEAATVLYRACAALLSWPDGGRRLIGTDGLSVEVEPGEYGIDAHTMATIDAAVHPSAVVHLPPRQQRQRPSAGAASAGDARGSGGAVQQKTVARRTGGQTAMLVIFGVLAGLWSLLALSYTVFGFSDPETSTGEWAALAVFLWGVGALLAWPAVRVVRSTRRG